MDKTEIRNDDKTDVAPFIETCFGNGDSFKKIQQDQDTAEINNYYNYVLKCTDGIFENKFIFINTTPDGELFGSGDPEQLDLTMYIESANLSEKHAEIKFVENCKYLLRDCDSETGTWVRIGHPGEYKDGTSTCGLDLFEESRSRVFKAGDHHFVFDEHESEEFPMVTSWLQANLFNSCIPHFEGK
jgi:hypothetical protein